MAPLDAYCLILLGVWLRSLGGDYWAKGGQADAARFIAACTKPVEAETSTREGAIRKRLKRLEDSGAIVAREEGTAPANPRDGELWVDSSEVAGVRPAGHGQTKPN
jgi:hypothetical protein